MKTSRQLAVRMGAAIGIAMLAATSAFAEPRPWRETRDRAEQRRSIQRERAREDRRGDNPRNRIESRQRRDDRSYRDNRRNERSSRDNRSYRNNRQPYYAQGRITNVRRHGSGYRVWVHGARHPFFIPASHWRRDRFRVGLVINLGDLMQRWTNDRWRSTMHRVVVGERNGERSDGRQARRLSMPFFHNAKVYTAYEYLERRFDAKTRAFTSVLFLFSRSMALGVVISAPAVVLSVVLGINVTTTVLLIALPTALYTMFGGVQAVTWTDVKQMVLIVFGMAAAFVVLALLAVVPSIVSAQGILTEEPLWGPRVRLTPFIGVAPTVSRTERWAVQFDGDVSSGEYDVDLGAGPAVGASRGG